MVHVIILEDTIQDQEEPLCGIMLEITYTCKHTLCSKHKFTDFKLLHTPTQENFLIYGIGQPLQTPGFSAEEKSGAPTLYFYFDVVVKDKTTKVSLISSTQHYCVIPSE